MFNICSKTSTQLFGKIRRLVSISANCSTNEQKLNRSFQSLYSSIHSSKSSKIISKLNMSSLVSSSSESAVASKPRGAFIVFEGIDRCGKTTQCKALEKFIDERCARSDGSKSSALFRFPNRESQIGKLINDYLASTAPTDINDRTIHLLFSANRWEQEDLILKTLESGVSIICDRYAYSGVAFSSAKGMDMDWCRSCDRGLPAPDCVLYLDMPVENAAKVDIYLN
jgi:dTMP kinase